MSSVMDALPSREEEQVLIQAANACPRMMDKAIDTYKDLVNVTANKWSSNTSLDIDDLKQEGLIGLYKAIQRFDCFLGPRFSTYAISIISGAIRNAIAANYKFNCEAQMKEQHTTAAQTDPGFTVDNPLDDVSFESYEDSMTRKELEYLKSRYETK